MYSTSSPQRLRALLVLAGLLIASSAIAAPYAGEDANFAGGASAGMIPWQGDAGTATMPAPQNNMMPANSGPQGYGAAPAWNGAANSAMAPRAEPIAYVPPPPGPYPVSPEELSAGSSGPQPGGYGPMGGYRPAPQGTPYPAQPQMMASGPQVYPPMPQPAYGPAPQGPYPPLPEMGGPRGPYGMPPAYGPQPGGYGPPPQGPYPPLPEMNGNPAGGWQGPMAPPPPPMPYGGPAAYGSGRPPMPPMGPSPYPTPYGMPPAYGPQPGAYGPPPQGPYPPLPEMRGNPAMPPMPYGAPAAYGPGRPPMGPGPYAPPPWASGPWGPR
ncbi:hypothetical protein [Candidatus Igneacidithiobacillus taiwanensis]|uniref:hypothetical protein n=2 Tax=Candidatus Igneacidithiobacillus taiwanensis TaxID=1945924 RepID=UPI00289DE9B3|nr:hypothetical protein [Candidatus Igneacidithiobacillus taiwanensis]MCE5360441.1 hypothetical protein [Acidithiobacillus sp.]